MRGVVVVVGAWWTWPLLAAALGLQGCMPLGPTQLLEAAACEQDDGCTYTDTGNGYTRCLCETADKGKPCTRNDECEAYCEAPDESCDTATQGTCAGSDFAGCECMAREPAQGAGFVRVCE